MNPGLWCVMRNALLFLIACIQPITLVIVCVVLWLLKK